LLNPLWIVIYLPTSQRNIAQFFYDTTIICFWASRTEVWTNIKPTPKITFTFVYGLSLCVKPESSFNVTNKLCNEQPCFDSQKSLRVFPCHRVQTRPLIHSASKGVGTKSEEVLLVTQSTHISWYRGYTWYIHHDIFLHFPVGFPMPWRLIRHRSNINYITGFYILS
jgi:hypothetical protein